MKTTLKRLLLFILCTWGVSMSRSFGCEFNPVVSCDQVLCTPLCVELPNYDYFWDFGDGSTSHDFAPPPHSYIADGTYLIVFHVYLQGTTTDAEPVTYHLVTIECCTPLVPAQFIINIPGAGMCNTPLTGAILPGPGIDTDDYCISIDWGDGGSATTSWGIATSHTYLCEGTYTVLVTVSCCDNPAISTTKPKIVNITCECSLAGIDFDATLIGIPNLCNVGLIVNTDYTFCPEMAICYKYFWGDGDVTDGDETAYHTYDVSGTYQVHIHIFCCGFPGGGQWIHREVTVNCACEAVPLANLSIEVIPPPGPENCIYGFALDIQNGFMDEELFTYSVTWEFQTFSMIWDVDTLDGLPPSVSSVVFFEFCNGLQSVCAKVYCNEDPSIFTEVCTELFITDCPCLNPVCEVFPSFTVQDLGGCEFVIQNTTQASQGTTLNNSMEFTITDQNQNVVFSGTNNFDIDPFLYPPPLPPGTYDVHLTTTGQLGVESCGSTYSGENVINCVPSCPGDLTGDNIVNISDMLLFLALFGAPGCN